MSINQDAIKELSDTTGLDEDALRNSIPDVEVTPPIKIVAPDSSIPARESESDLNLEIRNKLLSPTTQIETIRGDIERLDAMKDIQDKLSKNALISSEDADNISVHFEGFYKAFNKRSFTKEPTSVNYIKAKSFIDRRIKARIEDIGMGIMALFDDSITEGAEGFETYRRVYSASINNELMEFNLELSKLDTKSTFIHFDRYMAEGMDLLECSFREIIERDDESELRVFLPSTLGKEEWKDFVATVKDMDKLLKSDLLAGSIVLMMKNNLSIDDLISSEGRIASHGTTYSCGDVLKALADPRLREYLNVFEHMAGDSLATLKSLDEKSTHGSEVLKMKEFVKENGEVFDKATDYIHYYQEMVDVLRRMIIPAKLMLRYIGLVS